MRVICAHATQPQAVRLRSVVNRQLMPFNEFLTLARGETQRVTVSLQGQKQLGSVFVLPFASINGATAQAHDDRQVLNSHGTRILASATRCALKYRFGRDVLAD